MELLKGWAAMVGDVFLAHQAIWVPPFVSDTYMKGFLRKMQVWTKISSPFPTFIL